MWYDVLKLVLGVHSHAGDGECWVIRRVVNKGN